MFSTPIGVQVKESALKADAQLARSLMSTSTLNPQTSNFLILNFSFLGFKPQTPTLMIQ